MPRCGKYLWGNIVHMICFMDNVCVEAKQFNIWFTRPSDLVSLSERPLDAFTCLPLRRIFHLAIKLRSVECCRDGCPPHRISVAKPHWLLGSGSPTNTNTFLYTLGSQLYRALVVPNFFYFRIIEAIGAFGNLQCSSFFAAFCRSSAQNNPVSKFFRQWSVCLSKSCSAINWIYHKWTLRYKKHLKDDPEKREALNLNLKGHSKGSEKASISYSF